MEFMNGSAVTTPEASTNITTSGSAFLQEDVINICMMSCHFMFGLPINSYIIWLIVTGSSGVASEFFNLNLSVCGILFSLDSFFAVLSIPLKSQWCASLSFFFQSLVTGHPLFQCLMCVERYLAVVHPVTFLKYKPLRYRVICCSLAWIFALGSCLFFMSSSFETYTWVVSVDLLIVFSIQLFCLVAVLRALKQSGPGEKKREKEENRMKRRAFYLILITTLNTIIMYLPSAVSGLITVVIAEQNNPVLNNINFVCFTLACFVQPVLYLRRTEKICFCCAKKQQM